MSKKLVALAVVLGSSAVAIAQNEGDPKSRESRAAQDPVLSLEMLRGAEAELGTGRSGKGGTPPAREPAASPKGQVRELIVGSNDGRIAFAVVSVGAILGGPEKEVLVPASNLRWTVEDGKPCCLLEVPENQLQGMPEFDVAQAKEKGVDEVLGGSKAPGTDPGGASPSTGTGPGTGRDQERGTRSIGTLPRYLLSSELCRTPVHGEDKAFGKVSDAAVETRSGTVAYLIVTPEGAGAGPAGSVIVPFDACALARPAKEPATGPVLQVRRPVEELRQAPKYERPQSGFLSPDQMRRASEYFGVGVTPG